MNKITFPLQAPTTGAAVADLQAALQLLLDRSVILANDAAARQEGAIALQRERTAQTYGAATTRLVAIFQEQRRLQAGGTVDQPTADALNALLKEWGLLEQPGAANHELPSSRVVSGQVQREDGLSLGGMKVQAFHQSGGGPIRLGADAADAAGRYTIRYEMLPEVEIIDLSVSVIDAQGQILQTSDAIPNAKPLEIIDLTVPITRKPPARRRLEGHITLQHGLPAAQLKLRLYRLDFAGKNTLLGETTTLDGGRYAFAYDSAGKAVSLEVRAVNAAGEEVAISRGLSDAGVESRPFVKLVAPSTLQPLAAEYSRLAADLVPHVGDMTRLSETVERGDRQDLTMLSRATDWDARLIALAAMAAAQATVTGMGQDALYALFRVGLPTDPQHLAMVPLDTVKEALTKGNLAGLVSLNDEQIGAATTAFQEFANRTRLTTTTPGAPSSFGELLTSSVSDPAQRAAFAKVYFSSPSGTHDLWQRAAEAQIPAETIDALKLQGKLLHLTFNNAPLAQKLQQSVGSIGALSGIVDKDLYDSAAWKSTLTEIAGSGGDEALAKLIPTHYNGESAAERLDAYAADLARKVRIAFPTNVVARMVEKKELAVPDADAAPVSAFLRTAAPLGYELGRTPFSSFVRTAAESLPTLEPTTIESLKTLHRLYQITPSTESLQTTMKLGFKSAHEIASVRKEEFMMKHGDAYPSKGEALLVYGRAQQVKSVTFNFFSLAKQVDTAPPVYALSPSDSVRQDARDSIVQQFPDMEGLFGSTDFCECEECRSVLSPAAYFVDLLELLRKSPANKAGYTPLDVLIGKDPAAAEPPDVLNGTYQTVAGRRPDLSALPLTCENTNTAMPYIDLVNEILEYFIAHSSLGPEAAYDTGGATTADLTAEPQHLLPQVYTTDLRKAVYPLNLPFDLWIETVRGFLRYFKHPLAEVLETLRPVDKLELFTDPSSHAYYRAQILAESLGLSPAEYGLLTVTDPATHIPSVQNWFQLYGSIDEPTVLNGKLDPTDLTQYLVPPLKFARHLSRTLGLTYQELTDLVTTGFLNPGLSALSFQFERFGIGLSDAFSYSGEPGYPALTPPARTDFESKLDSITARYKQQNPSSSFDAKAWLAGVLPAGYSGKVLVLQDANSGCDFSTTTLVYADGSAAQPLDFLKLNLFVRLWKKLGWTIEELDGALRLFFPSNLPAWTDPNFAASFSNAWKTALVYLAHLEDLNKRLAPALGRAALLPLWANLATHGTSPAYAELFLTPGVLSNDWAFDDPSGAFPWLSSDPLSAHLTVVQGVTELTSDDVLAILADADAEITKVSAVVDGRNVTVPGFSLVNLSIFYRYSTLSKCLELPVSDLIALKAMSGLDPFQPPGIGPLSVLADDVLLNETLAFVKAVDVVQDSGFSVEDLRYLLRHDFDPVGQYASDPNAEMALIQSLAGGLRRIQAQNAVPSDLTELSESLLDQRLSSLFPAPILKALFAQMNNSQTHTASIGGVALGSEIDAQPFAGERRLAFIYDPVTEIQTATWQGWLLDWEKARLLGIDSSPTVTALLDDLQAAAQAAFERTVGDILGVWASLARYEAVKTGVAASLVAGPLLEKDSALSLSYDQSNQLQWLAYRGVLTEVRKNVLTGLNPSPDLASLLDDVQQQAMPAYRELSGRLLAMGAAVQSYEASEGGVGPADQIDPAIFSAYPAIRVRYDSSTQTQTLTHVGVLTDANRAALAARLPSSAVLASLLQIVRNQAVNLVQARSAALLTFGGADLDAFSQPFAGVDDAKKSKRVKAALVNILSPLVTRKLSRQLVLQTLTAHTASPLTEALVTDAALLTDPANRGRSLLEAFLAVGERGVTASYYASPDQTGPALSTGTAAAPDTTDPSNPNANKAGTGSAHFGGYLEVPTDGPYRFFAELGNKNAEVSFRLDAPDPTALFHNPIIQQTAAKDRGEASQFVQLKGGAAYQFTVDFRNLGGHGASLRLQGENLPKGSLAEVVLYPENALAGFRKAKILLSKVLQILEVTRLDERELSYVTANAGQFNDLSLSALPTQTADDSDSSAVALFSQFACLANYADLRKGPAGGTNRLAAVFENVGKPFHETATSRDTNKNPDTPWNRLATMTRRDAQSVRDVARSLGMIEEQVSGSDRTVTAVGDFANDRGIRRIWQALQLLQITGMSAPSLVASTVIASAVPPAGSPSPDLIAANFKNGVKARYSTESWRPVAQSVFDALRRKKRDALVAFLVHALGLESSNQLFEYFLIDPGMEPVVQTSRLRLAMSSVQTFIQRCLLNLENGNAVHPERNVAPSAIEADWWEWMKRYRVWQANREIFLFPENWMEPELRLDKTDLFQVLEGSLLQGNPGKALVEDAFLTYLKGLEVRGRLDIVATYLDQDRAQQGLSTLHVLGRTYGTPHKYFYRNYTNGSWSGWEVVTPDIEGDHIVLAVWQGRLNIFWVTFITQAQPAHPSTVSSDTTPVSDLSFSAFAARAGSLAAKPQVKVQLHWTEFFQGKWSPRVSTDVMNAGPIDLPAPFDPATVFIHVSKEVEANGVEGAVKVHLDIQEAFYELLTLSFAFAGGSPLVMPVMPPRFSRAFRITSRNCDPAFGPELWEPAPSMPYNVTSGTTSYTGASNTLAASFESGIASDGSATLANETILHSVNSYAVVPCGNPVAPPFLDSSEPQYWQAGALVSPFFYKDTGHPLTRSEHTFFVQPSLTEKTIVEYQGWAVAPSGPDKSWYNPKVLEHIQLVPQTPLWDGPGPVEAGDPVYSLYPMNGAADWATNRATAIAYGDTWIGKGGAVNAGNGSAVASPDALPGIAGAANMGLTGHAATESLILVGRQGLNANQLLMAKTATRNI